MQVLPHALLMKPGKLEVKNSDPVMHGIRIYARLNPQSNHMTAPGSRIEPILARPEIVTERCDIHPRMRGYIVVAKNSYDTVSQTGGVFNLTDVPPGTDSLRV